MQKIQEREVKFHIEPDAAAPDLTRLPDGLTIVERPEVRLSARYYDTADLDLLRRGITLRHRRDLAGDGEDLWTLKLPDAQQQTVLSRTEVSWPGDDDNVPDQARRLLTAVLHEDDLRAVAAFVTVRQRREVQDKSGRRLAEVDDDRVTVTAPTAKVFRQIEVELDAGDVDLIARLTKLLRRSGASRSDNSPKLRLVLAERIGETTRPTSRPTAGEVSLGELLRDRITVSFDKLVTHDIALRLDEQSEDVHQARVACRRLRSDLRTFAPLVDPDWSAHISAELRWIGNELGGVRDLDVLGRRIADHAGGAGEQDADGFAEIAVRIAAQRAAAWDALREALDSDRYQRLLGDLDAATDQPPLRAPETVQGRRATRPSNAATAGIGDLVRRPWRRLLHTVRDLPADPSNADLHRVRIRAKALRYAAESATSVVGSKARRLARAAEHLQTELGDHHDAVVAEEALRHLAAGLERRAAFVAGRCVAAEQQAQDSLRAAWPEAWAALDDKQLRRWFSH